MSRAHPASSTDVQAHAWSQVHLRRLHRGVNLSHWYAQVYREPGYVPAHFDSWVTDADAGLISAAGFDHVRLSFSLEQLAPTGGRVDGAFAERIASAIRLFNARDLAVIVDAHPEMGYRRALITDATARGAFADTWRAAAETWSFASPELTAFELLNEPCLGDASLWNDIASEAVAAIRAGTPDHSVVVSGDGYSNLADLVQLDTARLPDNVVLNMHHYEPMAITHQSAYFAPADVLEIEGLSYPVNVQNVATLLRTGLSREAHTRVEEFLRSGWAADTYRRTFCSAVEFAGDRPVICNEFGVFKGAPRDTRLAWTGDIVAAMEASGVGWTIWDYAGDFAVTVGEPGERQVDENLLSVLGLHQPTE